MQKKRLTVTGFSWGKFLKKSAAELAIDDMFKRERVEKIEAARAANIGLLNGDTNSTKAEATRDSAETDSKELNGHQLKSKTETLEVLEAWFMKLPFPAVFKKLTFKVTAEKETAVLELKPAPDKGTEVFPAKLDISFSNITQIRVFPENDSLEIEAKEMLAMVESRKKKEQAWVQKDPSEILKKEEIRGLNGPRLLTIKFQPKELQKKLLTSKKKILDVFKSKGILVTFPNAQKSGSDSHQTLFQEITDPNEIRNLLNSEENLMNSNQAYQAEALRRLHLPKFPASVQATKRCPIYQCFVEFKTVAQLQAHISANHKALEDCKITIDDSGQINFPENIIKRALFTTSIFWEFVKEQAIKPGKKRLAELSEANKNGPQGEGTGQQ